MIFLTRIIAGNGTGRVALRNYQDSGEYDNTARISRTATLDGSSHFDHLGVTDTDRDFQVVCRLTAAEHADLKALFESGETVRISFWEGCFLGLISRLNVRRSGEASITLYFKERLA